jgi:hypothetical protein
MELLLAQLHHEAGTVPSHAEREPELVIRVVRKSGTRIKPEARKHPHHRRIDRPLALAVDCRNFAKADFRSTTDIIRGKPQRLADALHVVDDLFRPVMRTTPSGGHSAA